MTLQAALGLLDLGLSPAASRSLARGAADTGGPAGARDLVKTLELVYTGVALLIVAGIALAAPVLADRWLHVERLSTETVRDALRLMAAVVAVQWPTSLYRGGLQGLNRQVGLNAILAGTSLVRAIATLAVLWTVSATILAFFACQLAVGALQTILLRAALWRSLPVAGRPARVRPQTLAGIRRFAGGMMAIAAVTLILTQVDKLVVSKLLPLGEFGYYTLASMIAGALALVSGAVFNVLFPEYSRSVAAGGVGLAALYHRGCQVTSVLVLPVASVIVLFPRETVLVWTGDPLTAGRTALAASLLVGGSALNGLMNPPYALQLAHGWTSLAFRSNVVAVIVLVPLLIFLTSRYGIAGAASVWLLLNAGYVLIQVHLMHRRLLPGEKRSWYAIDVAGPFLAAFSVAAVARWAYPTTIPGGRVALAVFLVVVFAGAQAAAALAAPAVRTWLWASLARLRVPGISHR